MDTDTIPTIIWPCLNYATPMDGGGDESESVREKGDGPPGASTRE